MISSLLRCFAREEAQLQELCEPEDSKCGVTTGVGRFLPEEQDRSNCSCADLSCTGQTIVSFPSTQHSATVRILSLWL